MHKLQVIKSGKTKSGETVVIAHLVNAITGKNQLGVWETSVNYRAGKLVRSWGYIAEGISMVEAEQIFERRAI